MKFLRALLRRLRATWWLTLPNGALALSVRYWSVLLVLGALLILAYQTGRDIFFRLAYLVIILIAFSFVWALYGVLTFRLYRQTTTPRAAVGSLAEERFLVQNTGAAPKIWIEIRDESELLGHRASRVLNALRSGARWSWSVRTLCRKRGRFALGPIIVSAGDPFGLFVFHRRMPQTQSAIIVFPATVDLATFAPPLGQMSGGDMSHRRTHHVTTNVSGTREYAPGDSFSRIHWRSTARTGRLIVKEFELDPSADVWIFLDLERDVQVGRWWAEQAEARDLSQLWMREKHILHLPPLTEEYLFTIAASIAKYFIRHQRAVGFVAYGQSREVIQPDRGERQLNRLLEIFAVMRAEGTTRLRDVLMLDGAHLSRNDTLVAITPSAELDWVRSLRETKRRGVRVIAVITEPSSFGGAYDARAAAGELAASGIPAYLVREGDDLRAALAR
ncbi:MAG: DUF58 domain-containing protein [Chloroflexi bacterium]|nr:DUF58 domain-containing protein [Chloroflexota bacterium]